MKKEIVCLTFLHYMSKKRLNLCFIFGWIVSLSQMPPTMFKPLTAEITYCAFRGGFKSKIKFYLFFVIVMQEPVRMVFASRDTIITKFMKQAYLYWNIISIFWLYWPICHKTLFYYFYISWFCIVLWELLNFITTRIKYS